MTQPTIHPGLSSPLNSSGRQCCSSITSPRSYLNPLRHILPPLSVFLIPHCVVCTSSSRGNIALLRRCTRYPILSFWSVFPLAARRYSPQLRTLACSSSFFLASLSCYDSLLDLSCICFCLITTTRVMRHPHFPLLPSMPPPSLVISLLRIDSPSRCRYSCPRLVTI